MGVLKVIVKAEAEKAYLLNCFHYIIHGHTIPGCYGGINVCPERAYQQMLAVKQYYGKTTGNQLVHFVICLNKRIFDDEEALRGAYRIAGYYGNVINLRLMILMEIGMEMRFFTRERSVRSYRNDSMRDFKINVFKQSRAFSFGISNEHFNQIGFQN